MIERTPGGFTGFDIECDSCGQSTYLDYGWDNFRAAIAEAKSFGWRIEFESISGEWEHTCPDCQDKEKAEQDGTNAPESSEGEEGLKEWQRGGLAHPHEFIGRKK